jgi:hypothetical protein
MALFVILHPLARMLDPHRARAKSQIFGDTEL